MADLGRSAFFLMALSIPDFGSFQLDAVHAVRRAMRLWSSDALSSRSRLFSHAGDGFLAFVGFEVVAGESNLARPRLFLGLRRRSSPNQALLTMPLLHPFCLQRRDFGLSDL